jgi:serine protein kinase
MSVNDFLYASGRNEKEAIWEGNFQKYFEMAIKNPEITGLATQRIYNMIMSYGVETDASGSITYNFFRNKIFGAEKQIEDIMFYLKAASMGLDIKKRVLLLLGPPGGGKSQILSLLKKGLAKYSRMEKGAIYAIKGCPLNEEPMHLIPESEREDLWKRYNIKIEGKLCPLCQFKLTKEWHRNLNNVEVVRIYIDEENRVGVGTFAPSEKNNMEELYGSVDLSKVDFFGDAGDSRAYSFNGELHIANRGIMEFIEVLKAKTEVLHVLLTLAEEQMFKTPRFPLQYVDETLIAHTNEGEFLRFISSKENEAIVDRLYIVKMPYNMEVENEEKIYHSALKTKLVVKGKDVHPGAIRIASLFAIKTRGHNEELRVGMSGISPRFILNTMAIALVKTNESLVSPRHMLAVLRQQIYHYPVLSDEIRTLYLGYLTTLEDEIDDYKNIKKPDLNYTSREEKNLFDRMIGDN